MCMVGTGWGTQVGMSALGVLAGFGMGRGIDLSAPTRILPAMGERHQFLELGDE